MTQIIPFLSICVLAFIAAQSCSPTLVTCSPSLKGKSRVALGPNGVVMYRHTIHYCNQSYEKVYTLDDRAEMIQQLIQTYPEITFYQTRWGLLTGIEMIGLQYAHCMVMALVLSCIILFDKKYFTRTKSA